jgi:hypothetical protein
LRFIWAITPSNTVTLRSLTFLGRVKIHDYHVVGCANGGCGEDLVESVQFYIPFFKKVCTNLKHLTTQAAMDKFNPRYLPPLQPGEPTNRNEALLPLLEGRIRDIQSIEKLEVTNEGKQPFAIANPTIK